ncbi:FtsX-like permease family protein, partial [Angustibacter aerolatus]
AARLVVVAVLAGRRGQLRSRRGLPVIGGVLVVGGAATALLLGTRPGGELVVVVGTLVMVLGAIAVVPAAIGLVGRLGARLPLPLRLAARDSSRQRSRTTPAVAAVMAAVAGITTLAIASASDFAQSRSEYVPRTPAGVTTVSGDFDAAGWTSVDRAVRSGTGRDLLPVGAVGIAPSNAAVQPQATAVYVAPPGCPALPDLDGSEDGGDDRCLSWQFGGAEAPSSYSGDSGRVLDAPALAALGYRLTAAQQAVLDAGGVLLPSAGLVHDGRARLVVYTPTQDGTAVASSRARTVPAAALDVRARNGGADVPDVVTTPATAQRLGLDTYRASGVLAPGAVISRDVQSRVEEVVRGVDEDAEVYTERGFDEHFGLTLLGLALAAAIAVLVGTLSATGLALAESRPDLATLAAIGARPRTRRVMASAQALVIAVLGALAGVLVGAVPGLAMAWPLTAQSYDARTGESVWGSPTISVPWLLLLGIVVAVPLVAALAAGAGVRSRLPLTRRLGQ